MEEQSIQLELEWKNRLGTEFQKEHMLRLKKFLKSEYDKKKKIYPRGSEFFAAFNHTPFDQVKVVIIGQDPYHGPGQAHGLCFSVKPQMPVPPSLKNIYKEIHSDLGVPIPKTGYLQKWAEQGVLLLNATLSVEAGRAGSHQKKGWEEFTDRAIDILNQNKKGLVFLLWGSYAQKKGQLIDRSRHLVLQAPHPSPLSAHRGFLGCKHFSKTNEYLQAQGKAPIDWTVGTT